MSEELSHGRRSYTADELSEMLHNERASWAEEVNALVHAIGFERVQETGSILEAVKQLASRPSPAVQVPDGYALVPLMSTSAMDLAGADAANLDGFDRFKAESVYNAMLAAPAPATVATEAVAQGGGVDVERVMALVEEYGELKYRAACSCASYKKLMTDAVSMHSEIRALLASPAPVGGWMPDLSYGKHAKEVWVIMFEDADVKPEVFIGEGAEAAARHRFKSNLMNWNCHLLCTAAAPAIAKQSEVGRG